jgi:hypothetical protein
VAAAVSTPNPRGRQRALDALVRWVASERVEDLRRAAERREDLAARLEARYGAAGLGVARAWLGRDALDALRGMGPADIAAVVDETVRRAPAQGLVLWMPRGWAEEQLSRVRDRLVGS